MHLESLAVLVLDMERFLHLTCGALEVDLANKSLVHPEY